MNQWCRSALCGHPLTAPTDSWTHGAASRHTIAPINHTRPSPRSRSYYSFPVLLRTGGWVGLSTQYYILVLAAVVVVVLLLLQCTHILLLRVPKLRFGLGLSWLEKNNVSFAVLTVVPCRHPLFPLLSLVSKKCELATNSVVDVAANYGGVCSVESFDDDLRAFVIQVTVISIISIIVTITTITTATSTFWFIKRLRSAGGMSVVVVNGQSYGKSTS